MGQYLPLHVVSTLTGNDGVAIEPTVIGNIDILGTGFLTVTGTPATSTLTISDDGTVATSYVTDAGTAIPAVNILNVLGGTNINTAGAANNVTINLDNNIVVTSMTTDDAASGLTISSDVISAVGTDVNIDITLEPKGAGSVVIDGLSFDGTTVSSITDITLAPTNDVIVNSGTPYAPVYFGAANELSSLGPLTDGELVIGSTGAAPVAASLTSADNTIVFTAGPGSLDLVVSDIFATSYLTDDANSAVPLAGVLTVSGGTNIATSSVGSTVRIALDGIVDVTNGGTGVSDPTDHSLLVGSGAGAMTELGVATDGELVIGSTGADPVLGNITSAGGTITVTNGAGTINVETVGSSMAWSVVGASTPLVVSQGFICTTGAALSFSLPAASSVGDMVALALDGSTSWTITQGVGQQIRTGGQETTAGAGGSIASTLAGDTIFLVCVTANLRWIVTSVVGNLTVV